MFTILTLYAVIVGWTLDYLVRAAVGEFERVTNSQSISSFRLLTDDPMRMAIWQAVAVIVTVWIVSKDLNAGLERAVKLLMPALFACLACMVIYSPVVGDFETAASLLLKLDFGSVSARTVVMAIG